MHPSARLWHGPEPEDAAASPLGPACGCPAAPLAQCSIFPFSRMPYFSSYCHNNCTRICDRCISPNRYGLGFSPQKKGGPRWLDGWAAATGLGSRWAPFMFPFWAPGSDGWAAATGLGFRWAPFMFPFSAPGSDGRAAAKKLGAHWAPFILPFWVAGSDGWAAAGPRPRSWAPVGLPSCFLLSGSWVGWGGLGWVGRGQKAGLALGSLHISFLGSWVGWVGRGQEAGLPFSSLHFFLGPGSDGPRQKSWARIGLPSYFLSGLLGRVGRCQEAGLSLGSLDVSFFLGSDGWAVPFIFPFWAPGSDGWAADPSDPTPQKGNMKGAQLLAALGRSPPIRPPSDPGAQKEGSMKGAQRKPSFLAAAHPSDPGAQKGNLKGAQWEPSFSAAAHPSDPATQKGSMKGAQQDPASWPVMFPFSCFLLGWMGRAHKAGLHWPPFAAKAAPITKLPSCFVFGLLGWMGGPRQRGWAPVRVPSCLLSGFWVGWVGRCWAPIQLPSFGWMGRGQGAGLPLGGSWVGWVGRGRAPIIGLPSCVLSGLLGGMGGPRLLGRMGGPRPRSCWAPCDRKHGCGILSSWLKLMDWLGVLRLV